MSIYVRNLNEDTLKFNCRLKISNFLPIGLEKIIEDNVPDNNYILGVKYMNGDSQICISGHPKVGETNEEGCERELTEELYLKPRIILASINEVKENSFYCINIKDTFISKLLEDNTREDIKERAVICVYGNEFEIIKYLTKLKIQEETSDFITSIWSAKKRKILSVIRKIRKEKKSCFIY